MRCMSVDLPDPDAPMIAVSSPRRMSTLTPASASTAAAPLPKRRCRSVVATMVVSVMRRAWSTPVRAAMRDVP
jgi:hypothetical protein